MLVFIGAITQVKMNANVFEGNARQYVIGRLQNTIANVNIA